MVYVGQQEERSDPPTEPAFSAVSSLFLQPLPMEAVVSEHTHL